MTLDPALLAVCALLVAMLMLSAALARASANQTALLKNFAEKLTQRTDDQLERLRIESGDEAVRQFRQRVEDQMRPAIEPPPMPEQDKGDFFARVIPTEP